MANGSVEASMRTAGVYQRYKLAWLITGSQLAGVYYN